MGWQRGMMISGLLAAWAAFATWQYDAYLRERKLIEETFHQQAHSVMNALVGGIRSHRRLGRFFEVQLQGMLDGLVTAPDVRAVSVSAPDGQTVLAAGATDLLGGGGGEGADPARLPELGDFWTDAGFLLVESFHVLPLDESTAGSLEHRGAGFGSGGGPGGGPGGGSGGGPGSGLGRGLGRARQPQPEDDTGPFASGGAFRAALLIDRVRYDQLVRRAAWSRALASGIAALGLACLALAWRASVRMVDAQGRTRVLELEARHLRELSQAAAGLAHETRNPLGLIRGWTQRWIEAGEEDGDVRKHGQTVLEECDRVTARINQFLAFARPAEPRLARIDLRKVCEELQVLLQPDLEGKDLELQIEAEPEAVEAAADREQLRQALFNLVQNAIQFAPPGGSVTIACRLEDSGAAAVEVMDRGPGVAEKDVDRLFTPYFTTRREGTGLGLAIVRRIAAAHGWDVAYRPRPGGGSVFALRGIHA